MGEDHLTIEEKLTSELESRGFEPQEAATVMGLVKMHETISPLNIPWGDPAESYKAAQIEIFWGLVRNVAIQYLEGHKPKSWVLEVLRQEGIAAGLQTPDDP